MQAKLLDFIERFKLPLALSFVGIVLIIGGVFTSGISKSKPKDFPKESLVDSQKLISVDIAGAVKNPGVYQLKDGSRIEELIKAADGFAENANQKYISKYLNLAQKLSDGGKVYISFEGEEGNSSQAGAAGIVANSQTKVNINSASQAELETLPGIGPVTASKIISGRSYQTIEELQGKKVVSNSVFEKIKNLVIVY